MTLALLHLSRPAVGECPPVVALEGEPETTRAVTRRLFELDVETRTVPGCPSPTAHVQKKAAGYTVVIRSGERVDYTREVDSVETVAALIDAYLMSSREALPIAPPRRPPPDSAPVTATNGTADSETGTPQTSTERNVLHTQLLFEPAFGVDKTLWVGGKLGVCGKVGPVCLGGHIRFAFDSHHTGPSEEVRAKRLLLDGALLAQFTVSVRRLLIVPGVDVGGGYYQAELHDETTDAQYRIGRHGGVRLGVFVTFAIRVQNRFAIEFFNISGSFSLPHHVDADPDTGRAVEEPKAYLRGGMGFSYAFPLGG